MSAREQKQGYISGIAVEAVLFFVGLGEAWCGPSAESCVSVESCVSAESRAAVEPHDSVEPYMSSTVMRSKHRRASSYRPCRADWYTGSPSQSKPSHRRSSIINSAAPGTTRGSSMSSMRSSMSSPRLRADSHAPSIA